MICSIYQTSGFKFYRHILLCFLFLILINGCSTAVRRDGPPPFDVDESKIADAKPKKEPLAKYGNMPSYRVFGQSYHVMRSAKHYHERGVASWYGTMFHAQRTSSGEPYNMLAMTAAHRTLPLPTYVQVTNLRNHKKIIVKVNDRGPFASDRIIDLSYVAAKKLGMLGCGTANVDVKTIEPGMVKLHPELLAKRNSVKQHWANSNGNMYLQVGAFRNRVYAEKLREKVLTVVSSPVEITHMAHARPLYRVKIGPIPDVLTANDIKKKLREIGLNPHHLKV